MLPVVEPDGRRTGRHAAIFALLLVPATTIPTALGVSGPTYAAIAIVLGAALLWLALRFAASRTDDAARRLFFATILYLPLIWIAMIWDKV
jgi:heme o synthase